jgi:hypothetical protein
MPPSYNPNTYCTPSPYYSPDEKNILAGFRDSIDPMMQAQMGICGTAKYLTGSQGSLAGVYYCMIQVLNDTVFNVTATNTEERDGNGNAVDISALSGKTIPAGTFLYGNFYRVVTVSGLVKIYPHPFL